MRRNRICMCRIYVERDQRSSRLYVRRIQSRDRGRYQCLRMQGGTKRDEKSVTISIFSESRSFFIWFSHDDDLLSSVAQSWVVDSTYQNFKSFGRWLIDLIFRHKKATWCHAAINPLNATLKPHSNGTSYSNTVIGTLAVAGWAVTFGTARRGLGGAAARSGPSLLYQI